MKKIIKLFILLVLLFFTTLFINYLLKSYTDYNKQCNCNEKGFLVEKSFTVKGIIGKNIRNSKVIVFNKKSNFNKAIDSTTIILLDDESKENQTFLLKESKVGFSYNYNVKFKKPITTDANWLIILNNRKKIKISEIKNQSDYHMTMFSKLYYCFVSSLKINGEKNDTLISNISQ